MTAEAATQDAPVAPAANASAVPVAERRSWVDVALYPIVVGLALLLQLMAINGVGFWVSFRAIVVVAVLGIVVSVALRLVIGERDRAGFASFIAMVALIGGDPRLFLVALLLVAILVVEARGLRGRLRVPWPLIGRASRVFALLLCLAIVVQAVQLGAINVIGRSLTNEPPFRPAPVFAGTDSPTTPDIYVILLDGYARGDALKQVFGVDESGFLGQLQQRGFGVSSRALTNYPNTVQVLMAMFNMRLLPDIPALQPVLAGTNTEAQSAITHDVVMDNPLFDTLHQRGYEIVGISSGFAEVSLREADRYITTGAALNEVEIGLLRRTIFGDVLNTVAPDFASQQARNRITTNFGVLGSLAAERPGHPRFIFDHIPSPHPPWVFNADGSPRTVPDIRQLYADDPAQTGLSEDELKAGYAGAVRDLQTPLLDAIDAIDRSAAVPPVILVFGDHGSWVGALPGDVRLRFLPLLAARVPGKADPLPKDETLVNVFPDLLNPVLGTSFPRVDSAPSSMFKGDNEYDLHQLDDPNGAIVSP